MHVRAWLLILIVYILLSFISGEGVETDPIEAAKMFKELSEKGHPFAQVR